MATRKDVAERAGVSDATVSYIMNDSKNVTPEVRERVLTAIRELDYRPNLVARGLATSRTRHVALLVDNLKNPYYCEMLEGAQHVASRDGYIVSVVSVSVSDAKTIVDLASRGVDGVILATVGADVAAYVQQRIPSVTLNDVITLCYREAVFDMVACLAGLGHRDIAILSGLHLAAPDNARFIDFRAALTQFGLPYDPALAVENAQQCTNPEAGAQAMQELLARNRPFTAVFAINDLMAIGAARTLWNVGLRVPQDVSLVGCDNLSILQWYSPSLSTMDAHAFEVGRAMMTQLISAISGKPSISRQFKADFIRRESVGPAPVAVASGAVDCE